MNEHNWLRCVPPSPVVLQAIMETAISASLSHPNIVQVRGTRA
jgi:hypothetical protein